LEAISGDALEIDELVIRFRFRRHYRYFWMAVSRLTHQVIGFAIGDRSTQTLKKLWRALPAAYRKKLVYTDGYESYAEHFSQWQHRSCNKGSGKTSVIEGLNNKWRNRVSGLVRKTVCVQHLDDLENRVWMVLKNHNLDQIKRLEKLIAYPL
jgi:IS1 family transposase